MFLESAIFNEGADSMEELKKTEPRLDVELLEQRAERLYTQLDKHRDYKTYAPTRHRLMTVKRKLVNCIEILDTLTKENEAKAFFQLIDPMLDTSTHPMSSISDAEHVSDTVADATSSATITDKLDILITKLDAINHSISNSCDRSVESVSGNHNVTSFLGTSKNYFDSNSDLNEYSIDCTLNNSTDQLTSTSYSPKSIVKTFSIKFQSLAETVGVDSGILQIGQVCHLFNSWYQYRFNPIYRDNSFYFKSENIHKWIDCMILSAGKAIHNSKLDIYIRDVNSWIDGIRTKVSPQPFPLPPQASEVNFFTSSDYTIEAALIEAIIKPKLYDESFYIEDMHTVRDLVCTNLQLTEDELTIQSIIDKSSKFILSSNFDISRFER